MRAAVLSAALALAACGPRAPGPQKSERGKVIYWLLGSSTVSFAGCTDATDWRSAITPPDLPDATFIVYEVATDGKTASAQSCQSTQASSCVDTNPPMVFTISGHTLTYAADPITEPLQNVECQMEIDTTWTLHDQGETASFDAVTSFRLIGFPSQCGNYDDWVKYAAPNGLGIDGCAVTQKADAQFFEVSSR